MQKATSMVNDNEIAQIPSMDSPPEAIKTAAATKATATSDSHPVQESPSSNYISNLSPIKPVKTSNVAQAFPGINSHPLVFTTPRLIPHRETNFVQRSHSPRSSRLQVAENDDQSKIFASASCNVEICTTFPGSQLLTDTQNHGNIRNPGQDQLSSPSGRVDKYLSDPIEVDYSNSMNLANPKEKQTSHVLQLSVTNCTNSKEAILTAEEIVDAGTNVEATQRLYEHAEEERQGQSMLEIAPMKCEEVQNGGEQPSNEGTTAEADSLITEKHEDSGENVGVIFTGSVQNVMQHDPEVGHHQQGMSRRCLQFGEALPPPYVARSPLAVSKLSGIGLHLNSIANALPLGHRATTTIKAAPGSSCQLVDKKISSSNWRSTVENVSITSEDRMLKTEATLAASESLHKFVSLDVLQTLEITPPNKRKLNSEFTDSFPEVNQSNPKMKRKKASNFDGDGCKRCNCKKSKCLKLYCDCFAAGIYCAEPCSCQGCFNRPEYEDTVLETRQHIESRNPLAFAPKIMQNITELPAAIGDDKGLLATSSARHKRGCHCKKSMCLKKYCECYQSNVGCSNECRCNGCKNVYGRKEYGMMEEMRSQRGSEETLESSVDNKLEMAAANEGFLHVEHDITPLTPSFQFADRGKDAPKSRIGRFVPSPESGLSMLPSYTKCSRYPSDTHNNNIIQEGIKEVGLCSSDQPLDYDIQMTNQFSPRCDELACVCDLSPLQNPPLSSASSKTRNWIQLCPGNGRLLPTGSLRWRGPPITPMAQFGDTKNQVLISGSGHDNIVHDDTPDILKYESSPTTSVKVSSPNKKRVSPPHGHILELASSSSSFKSGRKFILRAVPSFPPLTPCIDSKDSSNQKHQ